MRYLQSPEATNSALLNSPSDELKEEGFRKEKETFDMIRGIVIEQELETKLLLNERLNISKEDSALRVVKSSGKGTQVEASYLDISTNYSS